MSGLFCPNPSCGVATAFTPATIETKEGVLLDYSTHQKTVRGRVAVTALFEPDYPRPSFAIIECPPCGSFFLATREDRYSGWETTWPLRSRPVSEDITPAVRSAFQEALLCLAVKALGGCLLMCRTTLVRLQRDRAVTSLAELKDKGLISALLYGQADEVRLWANVVGHEDFDPDALTADLCEELVAYIQSLLDAVYVQPARLAKHRERRKQAQSGPEVN